MIFHVSNKDDEQKVESAFTRFDNNKRNNQFVKRNPFGESQGGFKKSYQKYRNTAPQFTSNKPKFKTCEACRAMNEPYMGHDIFKCPNINPQDRSTMLKSFALEVNDEDDDANELTDGENHDNAVVSIEEGKNEAVEVQRVGIAESPELNVKMNKTMVSMVLDTGATGSMIHLELCELANIKVYPTCHKAIQADGYSHLKVVGEIHTSIIMDNDVELMLDALVVTSLKKRTYHRYGIYEGIQVDYRHR